MNFILICDIISIETNSILDEAPATDLNSVSPASIEIPEVNQVDKNEEKTRIIYEKDVPNAVLREIYTSSKIMPPLYDYLDNKGGNINE